VHQLDNKVFEMVGLLQLLQDLLKIILIFLFFIIAI